MSERVHGRIVHRWPLVLAALLSTGGVFDTPAALVCEGGGLSRLPAPRIDPLRSYRAGLRAPTRLAIAPGGDVYIADPLRRKIVAREPSGRVLSVVDDLVRPVSLAVTGDRIFVGDGENGSVAAYTPDWDFLFWLGRGVGEFRLPADIAVDPASGNVWVTDALAHHVKLFGPAGDPIRTIGEQGSGAGRFAAPIGIAFDTSRNRVVVVDQLNARLHLYDTSGNYLSCIGSRGDGPGELSMPQSVWVDGEGRLFVADAFEGRVQILDGSGDFIAFLGEIGDDVGQLRVPGDLLLDPFGRLFVTSTDGSRVEMYGVGDYSDPESIIPADVEVEPDPLAPAEVEAVDAYIEVPGYALERVERETIRANGVPAIPDSVVEGDFDGDRIPDLRATFDAAALAETLPSNGEATVVVTAVLGRMEIEGSDRIVVMGEPDEDRDGVPDRTDRCPGTPAKEVVNEDGCGITQICPCAGPAPGARWLNHGAYVRCVAAAAGAFFEQGLITGSEKDALIDAAAASGCGRWRK